MQCVRERGTNRHDQSDCSCCVAYPGGGQTGGLVGWLPVVSACVASKSWRRMVQECAKAKPAASFSTVTSVCGRRCPRKPLTTTCQPPQALHGNRLRGGRARGAGAWRALRPAADGGAYHRRRPAAVLAGACLWNDKPVSGEAPNCWAGCMGPCACERGTAQFVRLGTE